MATIKQIPTDNSLTASTNVISMQYPNTILNTKMTLPQLVGPIDVVSPEYSSGDRSHEFQIASPKNASIEFSKAEYARSHQSRIRTLYHFSSFIQICTKPEAFLDHQPKILDISTRRDKVLVCAAFLPILELPVSWKDLPSEVAQSVFPTRKPMERKEFAADVMQFVRNMPLRKDHKLLQGEADIAAGSVSSGAAPSGLDTICKVVEACS